jgi:hypothetical protein
MTTLALIAGYEKLRDNEKVCRFCEITKALSLITFPIVLPFFIITMSLSNY